MKEFKISIFVTNDGKSPFLDWLNSFSGLQELQLLLKVQTMYNQENLMQGGSIMKGWMKDENTMITCCSDGTRPVIFKIERIDY